MNLSSTLLGIYLFGHADAQPVQDTQHGQLYGDLRMASIYKLTALNSVRATEFQMKPQRAILGSNWFFGTQKLKISTNLYESFTKGPSEIEPTPQLWDATWVGRLSDNWELWVGRQPIAVSMQDAPIVSSSPEPQPLTQQLGFTRFRGDGIKLRYTKNALTFEPMLYTSFSGLDGQQSFVTSGRICKCSESNHYSLSVAQNISEKNPLVSLDLSHTFSQITIEGSASTGAKDTNPFWGASGTVMWSPPVSNPNIHKLIVYERSMYISPSGSLRDLESRLQTETALLIQWDAPFELGISHLLNYPIDATQPIIHRASAQLHVRH